MESSALPGATVGAVPEADPGDEERRLQNDLLRDLEQEAAAEYEKIQDEEALYDAQRWETYLEGKADEGSGSEASTVRLTARKWEDVAMTDQLQWQRAKRLRVPEHDGPVSPAASSSGMSESAGAVAGSSAGR